MPINTTTVTLLTLTGSRKPEVFNNTLADLFAGMSIFKPITQHENLLDPHFLNTAARLGPG
jgi:hypothetical protein